VAQDVLRKPLSLQAHPALHDCRMGQTSIPVLEDTSLPARAREDVRPDAWLNPKRFGLMLGLFILALFPGVIFGTQTFFFRDYGIFGYPLASYHRECFWRGELPLWNPLSNCGLPYLAQWNTLTLYPLSLIYLLLPLPWSLSFFCLAHLFLAGLGMYFLALSWTKSVRGVLRSPVWTGSHLAAAVAGFAFAFNGLTLNCLMWPNNIAGLALMPWVIWRVERGWEEGPRELMLAALVGGLQMLSGAPEIILFTWLMVVLLWVGKMVAHEIPRSSLIWRMAIMVAFVAALAAAQLLPFLDLLTHSERDRNFGTGTWTMPQWGWLNLVLPLFKCYQSPSGPFFQPRQGWTSSYYPGIAILALAVFAGRFVRQRGVVLLWALTLAGLWIALGENGYVYTFIYKALPALGFIRFPIKFVVLVIFALPLLAAFAVARMESVPRRETGSAQAGTPSAERWTIGLVAILSALILGCLAYAYWHPFAKATWSTLCGNAVMRLVCLAVPFLILFRLQVARDSHVRTGLQIALVSCLGLDAWTHAPNQNPTVTPGVYGLRVVAREMNFNTESPATRAFMSRTTHDLLYGAMIPDPVKDFTGRRFGLFGNCNLLDHVPTPDGFYSLYLPEQRELWTRMFFATNFPGPLGDFLGISRISTNVFDWQTRPSARPLATIGARPVFADHADTIRALMNTKFNPEQVVYLPREAASSISLTNRSSAEVLASSFSSSAVNVRTSAAEPALLVVAQSYYHRWKAYVNGKPVKIWRANHAFQAVEVPAGESEVKFVYEDAPFRCGAIISLGSLVACLIALFRDRNDDATDSK